MPVVWQTSPRVSALPAGRPEVTWELARDDEACERVGAVVISWSGLTYADFLVLDSAKGKASLRPSWMPGLRGLIWSRRSGGCHLPLASRWPQLPMMYPAPCSLGRLAQALCSPSLYPCLWCSGLGCRVVPVPHLTYLSVRWEGPSHPPTAIAPGPPVSYLSPTPLLTPPLFVEAR